MDKRSILGWASAALVTVVYATMALPFRQALYAQAGAIVAIVVAVLLVGLFTPGVRGRLLRLPRPFVAAAGLYAAATLLGVIAGLAQGNAPLLLAGQFLSMALLPAAGLAAASLPGERLLRPCALGLCAAVVASCVGQFAHWATAAAGGALVPRLLLANNVSAVGPALAALLLCLAALTAGRRQHRRMAAAGATLIALYVVGSGVRGLWLATPVGILGLLLLSPALRHTLRRRFRLLARLTAAALLATLATAGWLSLPRPELLPSTDPLALLAGPRQGLGPAPPPEDDDAPALLSWKRTSGQRGWALSDPFPLSRPGTYRLRAEMAGRGTGSGSVVVQWFDDAGSKLGETAAVATAGPWHRIEAFGSAAATVASARLMVRSSSEGNGEWWLRRLELTRVGPSRLAPVLGQIAVSKHRLVSLATLAPSDPSLASRVQESRRLIELFASGTLSQQLFGHGLGALYPLETFGYDDSGRRRAVDEVNYIHNFYAFLLFKLGLVGAILVLMALLIWGAAAIAAARALPSGTRRSLAAAVAAGWIAYCLWSTSSAAILDFRIAPLWGFLLGALAVDCAAIRDPSGGTRGPRREPLR